MGHTGVRLMIDAFRQGCMGKNHSSTPPNHLLLFLLLNDFVGHLVEMRLSISMTVDLDDNGCSK